MLTGQLERLGGWIRPYVARPPWGTVLGLARTLLALGTLGTLLATPASVLLSPLAGGVRPPVCSGAGSLSLWCVLPSDRHELAKWVSIGVLAVVASGWRPTLTAIPHWWISWSFITSVTVQDGGDQVTAVLTLLLIPIALTDPRRWHWTPTAWRGVSETRRLVAVTAFFLIRVQVMVIYLHAGIAKLGVPEWVDGTAIFYWFRNVAFGAPELLRPLLDAMTDVPLLVALITWGSIVLEVLIGVALFLPRRAQVVLLFSGLLFHDAISALMGLWSFDAAMTAALVLYLSPIGANLAGVKNATRLWRKRNLSGGQGQPATAESEEPPKPESSSMIAPGGTGRELVRESEAG
ncbi:sporulation-delaying protein SdpB family protein [Microbispora rosea]|uniref:sporulation-delaying protein SdpB family protein n=1 Tax=Microbispora rosea TaxID=58117 RepID=UPI0034289B5C